MLTLAQPSAMGGSSEKGAVQASQIKPLGKGGKKGAKDSKGQPIVIYPRTLEEPKVYCPAGHEILLSRIPWQAGCRLCHGHNGWSPQIIAQYYNKVLDQFPLPWWEAVSDEPYLQVAQFKGKRRGLEAQQAQLAKGKGPQTPKAAQPDEAQGAKKPQPPPCPPMFQGTALSLFEDKCSEVATQLGGDVNTEVFQKHQAELDQWKIKIESHILKHKETSELLQQEVSDRQAMIQGISDDTKVLERCLLEAADWSAVLSERLTQANEDKQKKEKKAQAAQLLADIGDEEDVLEMAKKIIEERKAAAQAKASAAQASASQAAPPPPPPPPADPMLVPKAKAKAEPEKAEPAQTTGSEFLESSEKKPRTS